jgi:hypothetical protein
VQFAFKVIADSPRPTTGAELLAAAKAVPLTGTIDPGQPGAPTINATRVMQKTSVNPNAVVDGRVSPARGGYSYGSALWSIVQLNNSMQDRLVDIWPRIPGCPSEPKQMVVRTVAGS